ncbi:MAG: dephospho-CoA kinase [Saprospiraceae bacterium]|nr:dephospho-CoA kinase [Saprospiraceae bacterium]
MKKIGITGGIGSGKSTICKIFETLGIPVYYADQRARKLMNTNPTVKKGVKDLLGLDSYHKNGQLNRKYIGLKIFSDKTYMAKINQIVHPVVRTDSDRWAEQFDTAVTPYVVKEAALLVENGSYSTLDSLIVVTCPEELRIKRVMARDKISREEVIKKMKTQLPEEDKIMVADYLINNDGIQALIPQVWKIHHKLTNIK